MIFTLRQFLVFVAIIGVAIALTQRPPFFAFVTLVFGFGISFFLLRTMTWRLLWVCTLFGVGIYAIAFTLAAEMLAPPDTATFAKEVTERRTWIESTVPFRSRTTIPVGALFGLTAGIYYQFFRRQRNKPIEIVHRYWMYGALMVSTIGIVGALNNSIKHFYTMGKLLVLEFDGRFTGLYPPEPDRLFAVHVNDSYFAISYPLTIVVSVLLVGAMVCAVRREHHSCQLAELSSDVYNSPDGRELNT